MAFPTLRVGSLTCDNLTVNSGISYNTLTVGGTYNNPVLTVGGTYAGQLNCEIIALPNNNIASFPVNAPALMNDQQGGAGGIAFNVPSGATFGYRFRYNSAYIAQIAPTGAVVPGTGGGSLGTAGIYSGTGVPAFSAPNGSLFMRYDGPASNRLYLNTSGASTSGTTWTAIA